MAAYHLHVRSVDDVDDVDDDSSVGHHQIKRTGGGRENTVVSIYGGGSILAADSRDDMDGMPQPSCCLGEGLGSTPSGSSSGII